MKKRCLWLLLVATISSFSVTAQNTVLDSMLWNGTMHRFRVYEPPTIKCGLVMHLHGYGSNSFLEQIYTNYMPVADTGGFVVVYPDGLVDQLGNQSWNVGWFMQVNNDDVGFLTALIDTMVGRYNLDPSLAFVSGISNGGFMAHRLACEASSKIAAIASVSGGMTPTLYNTCAPAHAVPVLEIHGTNDETIPYPGGTGIAASVNIDSVITRCAAINGCMPTPEITNLPHDPSTVNNTSVIHYLYTGSLSNADCELYKIIDGAHVNWPGFDQSTTNDFIAAKEIWRFFRNYRHCNTLSTSHTETDINVLAFPNPAQGFINVSLPPGRFNSYELVDVTGRICLIGEVASHNMRIDLTHLTSGVYLLRLIGADESTVQKVVLE